MTGRRRARRLGAALLVAGLAPAASSLALTAGPAGAATRTSSARFVADVGVVVAGQKARVVVSGASSATEAQLRVDMAGSTLVVRRIGDNVYLHLPKSLTGGLLGKKTWVRSSVAALGRQLGLGAGLLAPSGLGVSGSTSTLSALARVATAPPRKVGTGSVRSVPTTAYAAEVDLAKVAAGLAARQPAAGAALRSLAAQQKLTRLPLALWVDAAGRVRQARTTVPLTVKVAGQPIHLVLHVLAQAWDFGAPVKVTAPPAGEVARVPVSGLVPSLGAGILGLL